MQKLSTQPTIDQWEDELTSELQDILECTRGDAQGFLEAQAFYMAQAFCKNMDAHQAALFIYQKAIS